MRGAPASIALLALASGSLPACSSPPVSFDSPDPAARLGAISNAARDRDAAAIPNLIASLDHDDPLVRLAALRALESLTGQTLGYSFADSQPARRAAIDRWIDWYRRQPAPPASRADSRSPR